MLTANLYEPERLMNTIGHPYTPIPICECPALGVRVQSHTAEFMLCRKLDEMGHGGESLTIYRNGIPALIVHSIAKAAKLTVTENERTGPRLTRYQPFPGKSTLGGTRRRSEGLPT